MLERGHPVRSHQPNGADAESVLGVGFWPVNIGIAARRSQVSAKMVRHYESLGLLPRVGRTENGYRLYSESDVRTLQFIKRSRELGFGMQEIAELVSLWNDRDRASAKVKQVAQQHLDDLSRRMEAMERMRQTLTTLLQQCQGDSQPDCPILDNLAARGNAV